MAGTIGTLNIRVMPDTRDFAQTLRDAVRKAEDSIDSTISLALDVADRSISDVRERISAGVDGLRGTVGVEADIDRESLVAAKAQLEQTKARVALDTEVDQTAIAKARATLDAIRAKVSLATEVDQVALTKARATIEQTKAQVALDTRVDETALARARAQIEESKARVALATEVDRIAFEKAKLQLDTLRTQRVDLDVHTNPNGLGSALSGVRGALADVASTGTAQLRSLGGEFASVGRRASEMTLQIAASAAKMTVVGAGVSALGSGAASLGAGLAGLVPSLLLLPGAVAGLGVSAGVVKLSLDTLKKNLKGFDDDFQKLKTQVGGAVWAQMGSSLKSTIGALLPVLSTGLVGVGTALGKVGASLSAMLRSTSSLSSLRSIFASVASALTPMRTAVADVASALLTVTAVSARQLPAMARTIATVSDSFAKWASQAAKSGQMTGWIDASLSALRSLGSMAEGVGRIVAGVAKSMGVAGVSSLSPWATAINAIAKSINGPIVQGSLTAFFRSAGAAATSLRPALTAVGTLLVGMLPTVGRAMSAIAPQIARTVQSIVAVLNTPAMKKAIVELATGIANGIGHLPAAVRAIAPAVQLVLPIVGMLATHLGQAAEFAGHLVGVAAQQLPPAFAKLSAATAPVREAIGAVVGALQGWLAENPQFAGLAGGLAAALPVLGLAAAKLAGPISAVVRLFGSFGPLVGPVLNAVKLLAGGIGLPEVALAALVVALVATYKHSQGFRDDVGKLMKSIETLVQPVLGLFKTSIIPGVKQVFEAAKDAFGNIQRQFEPLVRSVAQAATAIVQRLTPIVRALVRDLRPAFDATFKAVAVIVRTAGKVIGDVMKAVQGALDIVTGILTGNWSKAWAGAQKLLGGAAAAIKDVFVGLVKAIGGVIGGLVRSGIDLGASLLTNIGNGALKMNDWVVGKIKDMAGKISGAFKGMLNDASNIGKNLLQGIGNGIDATKDWLKQKISDLANMLPDVVRKLLGIHSPSRVFADIGTYVGQGLVNGLDAKTAHVQDAMSRMVAVPDVALGNVTGGSVSGNAGNGAGGVVYNIYNPVAEKTSDVVRTNAQRLNMEAVG